MKVELEITGPPEGEALPGVHYKHELRPAAEHPSGYALDMQYLEARGRVAVYVSNGKTWEWIALKEPREFCTLLFAAGVIGFVLVIIAYILSACGIPVVDSHGLLIFMQATVGVMTIGLGLRKR